MSFERRTSIAPLPQPDPDPAHAHRVRLRVHQVSELPPNGLEPLAVRAEVVAAEGTDSPIRHAIYLTEGARVGVGDAARLLEEAVLAGRGGRWATLVQRDVVLPTDMSAEITLSARAEPPRTQDYPRTPESDNPPHNRVLVNVGRRDEGSYTVVLSLTDLRGHKAGLRDVGGSSDQDGTPGSVSELSSVEVVVSGVVPSPTSRPFLLTLPSPFAGPEASLVVAVDVELAPEPADAEAWERHVAATELALQEGAESFAAAEARAAPVLPDQARILTRQLALRELRGRPDRVSLVYLTGTSNARVAMDLSLVASPEDLVGFVKLALPPETYVLESPLPLLVLGWHFDREALRYMSQCYAEGSLAPELRSVLLRHTGEVGRFPSMVEEAVAACGDQQQLEQRLIAENRLFLEDSDPSARVRAYDWLHVRGATPEAFDPLASRDERRAALEAERERLRAIAREEAEQEVERLEAELDALPRSKPEATDGEGVLQ